MAQALSIKVHDEKFIASLLRFPKETSATVNKAIKKGMLDVQKTARKSHSFKTRSGMAERSIITKFGNFYGEVSLNTSIAKYSPFLHEGTGLYGRHKKRIRPKKHSFLHFRGSNGRFVRKKEIDGIKGDQFLYRAFEKNEKKLIKGISKAVDKAIKKAGF